MIDRASALPFVTLLAVVGLGHLSLFPNVADLDGFYHIGHASAYLDGSPFDTSLQWATRSIIGDRGGDLWWGFHVLLMPFAALAGVAAGMQLAAAALTALLGCTVLLVLRRHGIPGAGWWAAIFLLAVPNIFYRHLMLRPHVISLAAAIALLSVLVRGRWWQVTLLSAAISWVHLSLFWMPLGIALAYSVVRIPVTVWFGRESPDTGVSLRLAVPAAILGVTAGWLLRPDAMATAGLLNVQLVQLFTQKTLNQPLTFAAELSPASLAELANTSGLFITAWLTTLGVVGYRLLSGRLDALGQARATLLFAALAISVFFFGLTLISARRAMEQWIAFGFLSLPLVWGLSGALRGARKWAVASLLVLHLGWAGYRHSLNVSLVAFPATTMQEVSGFLSEESDPGDLVFHTRWDNFGPLFAWNRTNVYLGGMDPIFQFTHDPQAFWEFFFLSADLTTEWTCNAYPCATGVALDTHLVLREHFGARWVVVEPRRNPRLTLYLLNDPRYELALETQRESVFEVLPELRP
jgi:hypothetical protein